MATLPADDWTSRESAREHATAPAAIIAGMRANRNNRGDIEAVVGEN